MSRFVLVVTAALIAVAIGAGGCANPSQPREWVTPDGVHHARAPSVPVECRERTSDQVSSGTYRGVQVQRDFYRDCDRTVTYQGFPQGYPRGTLSPGTVYGTYQFNLLTGPQLYGQY